MLSFLKENFQKSENYKKLSPLTLKKSSGSSRYCKSPGLMRNFVYPNSKHLSMFHRRNVTTIENNCKHSYSLKQPKVKYASNTCKGYNPTNPCKENQDSVVIYCKPNSEVFIFGVCDGHGLYGKEISDFVAENFVNKLKDKEITPSIIQTSIETISKELKSSEFNTMYSGTTLAFCIVTRTRIFSINIGDSRAILGKRGYIKWEHMQLTRDHKPDLLDENSRILSHGGRIFASNSTGPVRVWLPDKLSPGLAMSRSIGDEVIHSYGVTSEAEIIERVICDDDLFIVIGSDGLFEFLSNQDVVSIAGENLGNAKEACEELVNTARNRWLKVKFI